AVHATCLHKNLCDGCGGWAVHNACACPDRLSGAGTHPRRDAEPFEPCAGERLPGGDRCGPAPSLDYTLRRRALGCYEFLAIVTAGLRIHAAARRRRSPLYADYVAGAVRRQSAAAAATDGPANKDRT